MEIYDTGSEKGDITANPTNIKKVIGLYFEEFYLNN